MSTPGRRGEHEGKGKEAWLRYVKNVIRRYPGNRHAVEDEAVREAIKITPQNDFAIIESVLIKKTTTVREAAYQNYLSYTQTVERFKRFYKIVAINLGLPIDDEAPTPRNLYREDWHTYILNILARYPENRHAEETEAIERTLNTSDEFIKELITLAYIQRTESAQNVAYNWNVNPSTADHRKTAFFLRLAEALHLPTE